MTLKASPAPPMPPDDLRFMGEDDRDFLYIGDRTLDLARRLAGLGDHDDILDLGCGYGRLAHALLRMGTFHGTYVGLDILPRHIRWCQSNLTRDGIEFRHLDVVNDRYNPNGTLQASDVDLGSEAHDTIVLASVFTHMWPDDIAAYLQACSRALRPGGRVFATFFLLEPTWHRLRERGLPAEFDLPHERGPQVRYAKADDPLHVIAYELDWVRDTSAAAGLTIQEPAEYGRWSGRNGRTCSRTASC